MRTSVENCWQESSCKRILAAKCLWNRIWSRSASRDYLNVKYLCSRHDINTSEFVGLLSTTPVPAVSTTDYSRRHLSCQVTELRNSDQMLYAAGTSGVEDKHSANAPPVLANEHPERWLWQVLGFTERLLDNLGIMVPLPLSIRDNKKRSAKDSACG